MQDDRAIQYLPPKFAMLCSRCAQRVYFRVVATRVSRDGLSVVEYLRCPHCGAHAVRRAERCRDKRPGRAI